MSYSGIYALIGRPNAVDFRSSETNHIVLPSFTALNDFEIHTRIKYENEVTQRERVWTQLETTLMCLQLNVVGSDVKVQGQLRTSNTPTIELISSDALELGKKYDIRWVVSSTLGHLLYINGVLADSTARTEGSFMKSFNRSTMICASPDASNNATKFLNQPMEFMKITVGGTVWTYFPFLTNVKDASGNERDGTFTGGVKWAKI